MKLWQLKIKKLILKTNLIKKVELTVFDIIKIFRKSKKRFLFEKNLIFVFSKKLPFFAKILLAIDPFLIFNLIKLFSLVFKIIGTSNILGKYLVYQIKMLRKHWHFFRLLELVLNSYWKKYSYKIKGCKFALIGKINGSARTRKLIINVGSINIQKFSSLIDYSLAESFSLFGIFGIKIWLQFL